MALASRLLILLRRATPDRRSEGAEMVKPGTCIRDILEQIQGEYVELPGLRLTGSQAQRVWQLDRGVCDALLMALVDARFLSRTPDGAFVRRQPETVS
jgi:hypothetical protein